MKIFTQKSIVTLCSLVLIIVKLLYSLFVIKGKFLLRWIRFGLEDICEAEGKRKDYLAIRLNPMIYKAVTFK